MSHLPASMSSLRPPSFLPAKTAVARRAMLKSFILDLLVSTKSQTFDAASNQGKPFYTETTGLFLQPAPESRLSNLSRTSIYDRQVQKDSIE